jgi:hypothetical protein
MDILLISDPQTNQLKRRLIVCGHSNGLLNLYITDVQLDGTTKTIHKFFYYNPKPCEGKFTIKKIFIFSLL